MPSLEPLVKPSEKFTPSHSLLSTWQKIFIVLLVFSLIGGLIAIGLSLGLQYINTQDLIVHTIWGLFNPWAWIKVPMVENKMYLLLPTMVIIMGIQIILYASPQPKTWSRVIVASILMVLTLRYVFWRTLETLDFSTSINGLFSLLLWLIEMLVLSGSFIQLILLYTTRDRHSEADYYSEAVLNKQYLPSIDILIPTYNEPEFILTRTIVGCQAIDYPHKNIYILDDTNRETIQILARELECHYIARVDHQYAKAGNLNHALQQTNGELVAVFDADFIPCTNFLARTVGFFQKPQIALVQTPQSFYNADPIAYNLGLDNIVTPEEEVFYRYLQPMKDGVGSVVCAGTSFVVRRKALEKVGYFNTESLSEDYFTGIALTALGYKAIYLNQKLSAGLAAEGLSTYLQQRLRWARGTLQAFFISANPLTISGLNFPQRLAHLEGIIFWFSPISRLLFLLVPIFYTFFNVLPVSIALDESIYIFIPYFIAQLGFSHWLNGRSRSLVFSEVLSLVLCVPVALTVISILIKPFAEGFRVTPKGIARSKFVYHWQLAFPLLLLLITTAIGIGRNLSYPSDLQNQLNIALVWGSYNIFLIATSLAALLDAPRSVESQLLAIECPVQLGFVSQPAIEGTLEKLSEIGAEIRVNVPVFAQGKVRVDIFAEDLALLGSVTKVERADRGWKVRVQFDRLSLSQQRQLIVFLFCRPDRWPSKSTPGEWRSLWLLVRSLVRGLWLFGRSIGKAR
jgi:cellulose synthase (UDP-forming)